MSSSSEGSVPKKLKTREGSNTLDGQNANLIWLAKHLDSKEVG